jgi:hypothetical protein
MTLLSTPPAAPTALTASTVQVGTRPGRLAVPWTAVLTLAVLLDFADGFFMTALRNAVGAIERTQEPFTSYWRTCLLLLPVFAVGVLAALTVALRLFGPELRGRKQVLATVALVAAAAALVGAAATTASSAADYRLQSAQLGMMKSMRGTCDAACLAGQQHATALAHVRAIALVAGLMLITNLLVVGWLVALRGGRLQVSNLKPPVAGVIRSRGSEVRLLLVVGLVASAALHAAVVRDHLGEWPAAGLFFIALTLSELAAAGLLLTGRQHRSLIAAAVVSIGPLAVWLASRTVGLPFGPGAGTPEAVGLPDLVACALEVGTLVAALTLLYTTRWSLRPTFPVHYRALALVAVVAVTAIGLTGAAPGWMDGLTASQAIQHSIHHP